MQYNTIYNTMRYNTIQYNLQYNTIQYNTIQYNLQYDAIQYNTIQYINLLVLPTGIFGPNLQCNNCLIYTLDKIQRLSFSYSFSSFFHQSAWFTLYIYNKSLLQMNFVSVLGNVADENTRRSVWLPREGTFL